MRELTGLQEYVSTRGGGEPKSFLEILLAGLAPDGGLYIPLVHPMLNLNALRGKSYQTVAFEVLRFYIRDVPQDDLRAMIDSVYTAEVFGSAEITPLQVLEPDLSLLKLSEGPTFAFKDVALQLLGALMEYALGKTRGRVTIVGATSGDTGSAAEYALRGKENVKVFMLSPENGMSIVQRLQMYTLHDANIFNLAVAGTFDDCQRIVKALSADLGFRTKHHISTVNSINWARIAAQIVYYVYAYLQSTEHNAQRVRFVVPSGNFGNALAAYLATQLGVPAEIIVATNENDVLDEFFRTGVYRPRNRDEIRETSSPSMNIGEASNLERLISAMFGGDPVFVRALYEQLGTAGQFSVGRAMSTLGNMSSGVAAMPDVLDTIRAVYTRYRVIIDPHTAVAMKVALERFSDGVPTIVAETAQPAKFEETIREALGFLPPVPDVFKQLDPSAQRVIHIDPDPEYVKRIIERFG